MGSGVSRHLPGCFGSSADSGGDNKHVTFETGPLDETLGHSFCYVRSSSPAAGDGSPRSSSASAAETVFKAISGASVSANSSTPLPIYDNANNSSTSNSRSHFRSSSSFSAIPLQLAGGGGFGGGAAASGPLDRGFFLSGPIERGGGLSGPLDSSSVPFSGPIVKKRQKRGISGRMMIKKASLLRRSLSEKNRPWVVPLRSFPGKKCDRDGDGDDQEIDGGSIQWAHGKAGEDRVHVVVSESQRWLFVGIYDGFNGPEAPEFLVENLYRAVFNELKGLFWEEIEEEEEEKKSVREIAASKEDSRAGRRLWEFLAEGDEDGGLEFSGSGRFAFSMAKLRSGFGSWRKEEKPKVVQEVRDRECSEYSKKRRKAGPVGDHRLVLRALERALEITENAYLELTDRAMDCNPELALMGSCLLVVLMRDEDVYVMNLGDSRAIVAQYRGKSGEQNCAGEMDRGNGGNAAGLEIEALALGEKELAALQLSTDHSMSVEEEVLRIRKEHPDDDQCISNGRVKGRLKVTRAFGAGCLKHPKWNEALLEMFRNEYVGSAPYLSCLPSLCHHKLGASDHFLVLSSDGLYQYLSNEEVVLYVESFMERFPDGDPAQSLIEELLFRAAQKAGMGFSELLDIPQGDRRKYHDDVTVMVISLEGRIWKSSGKYV